MAKRTGRYYALNGKLGKACPEASDKQVSYLASLIAKSIDAEEWLAALSGEKMIERKDIGELIGAYKKGEMRSPAEFVSDKPEDRSGEELVQPVHFFSWFSNGPDGEPAASDKMIWKAAYATHAKFGDGVTVDEAKMEWCYDENAGFRRATYDRHDLSTMIDQYSVRTPNEAYERQLRLYVKRIIDNATITVSGTYRNRTSLANAHIPGDAGCQLHRSLVREGEKNKADQRLSGEAYMFEVKYCSCPRCKDARTAAKKSAELEVASC